MRIARDLRKEMKVMTQEKRFEILSRLQSAQGDVMNVAENCYENGNAADTEKLMEVSEDLQIIGKIISEEQTQ